MSRLSLSDDDKAARDWFVETTEALGCDVSIDSMVRLKALHHSRHELQFLIHIARAIFLQFGKESVGDPQPVQDHI